MTARLKTIRNNPNVSNWNRESGYKSTSVGSEYPLRVDESGPAAGLEITLVAHEHDRTYLCNNNDEEFEVYLSVPGESMSNIFPINFEIRVPISTNSLLSMEPQLTTTSEGLDGYSPKERGCFYDSERRLAYHKIYSENNCDVECGANFMIQNYECVPFFAPRT